MKERVLVFPDDHQVGFVGVHPASGEGGSWQPARGRVSVAANSTVTLSLYSPVRGLAWLGADDVAAIDTQKKVATDADLGHIAHLTGLRHLYCSKAHAIGDAGVSHLAGLRSLRELDLYGTRVTDASLQVISGMKWLEHLHLGGARINGSGLRHLRALQRLRWLSLEETDVDDGAVPHLAAMRGLRTVALWGTRMSTGGRDRLQRALPALTIAMRDPGRRLALELAHRGVLRILFRRLDPRLAPDAAPETALAGLLPPGSVLESRWPGTATCTLGSVNKLDDLVYLLRFLPAQSEVRIRRAQGPETSWIPWLRPRRGDRRKTPRP